MALDEADLSEPVLRFYYIAYADIDGEPLRVTTLPATASLPSTGDSDLDGFTFLSLDHGLVDVGDASHGRGGADTLAVTLRGLPTVDQDLLDVLADPANWRGRVFRLWQGLIASDGTVGQPSAYYTGYMNRLTDVFTPGEAGQPATRTLGLEVENYLTLLTTARGRTYQDQGEHDADDLSPLRMRSAANGTTGSGFGLSAGGGGGGYSDMTAAV